MNASSLLRLHETRPKPVEHGYVFSMAVGTIGEWLNWSSFFVRGRTVDSVGGGQFFKNKNILAVKHLKINIMAWVPRKINNPASIVARKRLEINILTRHKLPVPPSPAESNGRPLNFVVNVCFVCRICLGCFAWRTG